MMFLRLGLSLLWTGLVGYFFISIFTFHLPNYRSLLWPRVWLGLGLGLGIGSFHYLFWRIIGDPPSIIYFLSEIFVLAVLFGIYLYKVRLSKSSIIGLWRQLKPGKPTPLGILFSIIVLLSVFTYFIGFLKKPHGGWDAWMIWNLQARFMFRGGQEYWQNLFSANLPHPDYPLLVSGNVARAWTFIGKETVYAPALIGAVFVFSILGLLVTAGRYLRGKTLSFVAGFTLLTSASFYYNSATQTSDLPLSYYFLASIVLIYLYDNSEDHPLIYLALSGIFSGLAIWTKNEGWLFLLALILARLIVAWTLRPNILLKQEAVAYFSGLMPLLLISLYYKFHFTPSNDLVASLGMTTLQKLEDIHRYWLVAKEYLIQIVSLNPRISTPFILLPILGLFFGFKIDARQKPSILTGFLTMLFVLGGYAIIFVMTPFDLEWHLYTANARLFLHIWPTAIFTVLMMMPRKEQSHPS